MNDGGHGITPLGLSNGITDGLTADEYHNDPCEQPSLTSSIAKLLCYQSPAHAKAAHPRLNPTFERKTDEKFDVGTAVHALLLEGRNAVEVIPADDWRTAAAKEARDQARGDGRIPLLRKQWDEVENMLDALQAQLAQLEVDPLPFTNGRPEQTLVWTEGWSGGEITCRARLDWLHDGSPFVDDLKTTSRTADPDHWSRSLFGMGYDIQAAFYLRGLREETGQDAELRFVVAETSEPYAVSVIALAPDALALANQKVSYALELWGRCLSAGRWDGYPSRVCYAEAPSYEQMRWLEREAEREAA